MRFKRAIRKLVNKLLHVTVYIFSNVYCEAIRARIALKLGMLSFMIINAFLFIDDLIIFLIVHVYDTLYLCADMEVFSQ